MHLAFSDEPAVYVALATALLALAVGFGLPITPEQKTLIIAVLPLIAGVVIRSQVTPTAHVATTIAPPKT
jgi:putative Mn2+ efflux pump MntP